MSELFEFPCLFPIKVMGERGANLESFVREVLKSHIAKPESIIINLRESTQGNYISVTAKFEAESKEQLDAIYTELSASEQVKMVI